MGSKMIHGALLAVVLGLPFIVAQGAPASAAATMAPQQQPSGHTPKEQQPPAAAPADYAGESTCLTCHGDHSYGGTTHGLAFKERTPAATRGCESCHGPGKAHAESGDPSLIRRFTKENAAQSGDTCTTCHNRGAHALWDGSQHNQRNLGCTTCHSIHSAKGRPQLKARSQMELCSTCHRTVVNRYCRFTTVR